MNNQDLSTNRKPSGFSWPVGVIMVLVIAVLGFGLGRCGRGDLPSSVATDHSEHQVWTCSMHPAVQLPEPGQCPICFMDLIPLKSDGQRDGGSATLTLSKSALELAHIETAVVKRALAETEIRMVGKIAYDEARVSYITAWAPGRLDRLYADYTGVSVKAGEHLVYMYSPELLAAQEEFIQAKKATVALERSESRVLRESAVATLAAARDKMSLLGLTGAQIDSVEATSKTSDHLTIYAPSSGVVVDKHVREGMYVETGTRIYTLADLSKLWLMLEAYETDLPWLKYGQHVEFRIQSSPGETYEAIITFIDPVVDPKTRTVRVRAVVDNKAGRLKPDMFVRAEVRTRLDQAGRVVDLDLAGKWICPMHPEIVENRSSDCDICGMPLVRAEEYGYSVQTGVTGESPLMIPASAALITGARAVVYVETPSNEGSVFEGREIELGPRAGDFFVVKSGLTEGERVVVNGAFKLDAEMQIRAKPSMMSSPVTSAKTSTGDHSGHNDVGDLVSESQIAVATFVELAKALSDDDLDAAKKTAQLLETQLTNVGSKNRASQLAVATDFETARDHFFHLSEAIVPAAEAPGQISSDTMYVAFCPMARNNKGAYWLQTSTVISNPYYGAAMLRCGSIKDTILPGGKE